MTIVIPSWQTRELLLACLAALEPSPPTREVVVVDNASRDGSAAAVAARFPAVRLLRNVTNAGFASAVNQGVEVALAGGNGPVAILNADTICTPPALAALAQQLAADDTIGLIGPRLLLPDGAPQPYAFGGDPTLGYLLRRGWSRLWRHRALHDWADAQTRRVDWITFACVVAPLETLRQVGSLDTRFFMYFEDNDWCLRARRAGWGIVRCGAAQVIHIGGASLRQNPAAAAAYRDSLRAFYAKHYGAAARLLLRLLLPLYARCAERKAGHD